MGPCFEIGFETKGNFIENILFFCQLFFLLAEILTATFADNKVTITLKLPPIGMTVDLGDQVTRTLQLFTTHFFKKKGVFFQITGDPAFTEVDLKFDGSFGTVEARLSYFTKPVMNRSMRAL